MIWKVTELILKFIKKIGKDRVRAHSSEAAFFIIMSFLPMLMLMLTLIQYTPLEQTEVLYALDEITPFDTTDILTPIVDSIYSHSVALLSWTAIAAIWAAGKSVMGLTDGLNFIFQIEETRNYFVLRIYSACYTVIMLVALTLSLLVLVLGYNIQGYLGELFPFFAKYKDSVVMVPMLCALAILILLFMVLYTFLPNHPLKFRKQFPGAVFTAIAWAVFSYAFSIYLDFAGNMSVIYGSLTTLVVVMLWLYGSMYLLFIGAEINHYIMCPEAFELEVKIPSHRSN